MTGTLLNVITVLVGGILGAVLGGRLPERVCETVMHGLGSMIAPLIAGWAFAPVMIHARRRWLSAVAVSVTIGLLLEVAQGVLTTHRTAEMGDLLADCVGAATVYWVVMKLNRRSRKNR